MAGEIRGIRRWLGIAAALLIAAVFARNVATYYFLNDDAFISFRYSRFFADGFGVVWNPGDRVEGYTSFLWVVLIAAGMRLGIEPEILSNVLGIACGVAVLVLLVHFSARRWGRSSPWNFAPPLVLALSRNFTAWCTGGQETMLFVLLAFLALDRFFEERRRFGAGRAPSSILLALATLTRPEGMALAGIVAVSATLDAFRRSRGARALLRWGAPYVLIVGGHFLWRHAYYGAWLPNTFHAKAASLMVERGLEYLRWFQRDCLFGWFAPWILLAVVLGRDFERAVLLAWIVVHALYVVLVGGDVFEFRFLVFVFPAAYWLMIDGLRGLAGRAGAPLRAVRLPAAGGVFVALLFATTLGLTRDVLARGKSYLPSVLGLQRGVKHNIEVGRALRALIDAGQLPRDLYLGTGLAGAIPYYTGWRILDRHGLNDFEIARMPVANDVPGHQHYASIAYMRARGVEAVTTGPLLPKRPRFEGPTGGDVRVRNLRVGDRYFSILSLMSEDTFRAKFGHLEEVLGPSPPALPTSGRSPGTLRPGGRLDRSPPDRTGRPSGSADLPLLTADEDSLN